jgi:membrane-bound lytic murein transglycosylase F
MESMKRFSLVRVALAVTAGILAKSALIVALVWRPAPPSSLVVQPKVERDLPQIRIEGVLRVAVPEDGLAFDQRGNRRDGLVYDLVYRFANECGVKLELVPVTNSARAIRDLLRGENDIVAMADTGSMPHTDGVARSIPVLAARPMLVGLRAAGFDRIEALQDQTIWVKRLSPLETVAARWRDQLGGRLQVVPLPADLTLEAAIADAAEGKIPLLLVDETRARLETSLYRKLNRSAALDQPTPLQWALRPNSTELTELLDQTVTRARLSGLLGELERRYLENPLRLRAIRQVDPNFSPHSGQLSPYDDLFRHAAGNFGLDWRLLAAIAYIESRFDALALGEGGAAGLLQLMPATAEAFGADDPFDPQQNVYAGAKHLAWIADQFDEVPPEDRLLFAIAGYNMGLAHVFDAQQLARERTLDPVRWDGHVAEMLPLLEDPEIARRLPHGRARGSFTANYVRRVREAYARYGPDTLPGTSELAQLETHLLAPQTAGEGQ